MLRQLKPLLYQQLVNLFGVNVLRHTTDPKAKRRGRLMAVVWGILIGMVCFYMGALAFGLVALGAAEAVPAYLITLASLLIFFFGTFTAGAALYNRNGYEMLCALPVSQWAVVASRFARMLVENLLLTLVVMVPGLAVYAVLVKPQPLFYLLCLLTLPVVPLLPVAASAAVGAVVVGISSRMKRKALAETVISVAVVLGILCLTPALTRMEGSITPEMLLALSDTVLDVLGKVYPPAVWLGGAISSGSIGGWLAGLAVSVAVLTGVAALVAWQFHAICRRLFSFRASHSYQMETLRKQSVLGTLCIREFRRYFASGIYVTNTIIGPILATVLCGSLLFTDLDTFTAQLPVALDVTGLIPFLVAGIFCMMPPAAVSVSMEGKNFWIVKSLPLPTKALLDAKILMNLLLMLPFWLVSEVLLILALKPGIMELVWLILIPAVLMMFSCVYGVAVNLRFPVLDWENEAVVVKQSAASALGGFGGLLVSLLCAGATLAAPSEYENLVKLAICVILAAAAAALYRSNNRCDLKQL